MIQRYLTTQIRRDLDSKLVLLSGPRQVGKTTLARTLNGNAVYFNYDVVSDRKGILAQDWIRSADLVVLDELHKMKKWKTWLKGVWDGRAAPEGEKRMRRFTFGQFRGRFRRNAESRDLENDALYWSTFRVSRKDASS